MTVDCLAAMIGWLSATCEVEDHAGILRRARDAGSPGEGLEARALRIGGPAKAPPARHRHQRLKFHLVGEFG